MTFNANVQHRFGNKLAETRIKAFCEKLSVLKHLKELRLSFSSQKDASHKDVFSAFCESLKNLKELKSLEFNAISSNFSENSLIQLSNALPNLDSLALNCSGHYNELISESVLKQFFGSLVGLKSLSHLELCIFCEIMNDECSKILVGSFLDIESLNCLRINLCALKYELNDWAYSRKQTQKLGEKITNVTLSIGPCKYPFSLLWI